MKCARCHEGGHLEKVNGILFIVCPYAPADTKYQFDENYPECKIPTDLRRYVHQESKKATGAEIPPYDPNPPAVP